MLCYYPSVDAVTIATLPSSFLATELILDVLEEALMKKRRVKSPTVLNIIVVSQQTQISMNLLSTKWQRNVFLYKMGRGLFYCSSQWKKRFFKGISRRQIIILVFILFQLNDNLIKYSLSQMKNKKKRNTKRSSFICFSHGWKHYTLNRNIPCILN